MSVAALKNAAAFVHVGNRGVHIGPGVLRGPRAAPSVDLFRSSIGAIGALLGAASRGLGPAFKTGDIELPTPPSPWVAAHHAALKQALGDERALLLEKKAELARWDVLAKANFARFFGPPTEPRRAIIQARVEHELALNKELTDDPTFSHFRDSTNPDSNLFAYVHPGDQRHTIFLGDMFKKAASIGKDSKAGTLAHEMSHFNDIGATGDKGYGIENALRLAKTRPEDAITNADNFEYYIENAK